jgi:hypothetical protein
MHAPMNVLTNEQRMTLDQIMVHPWVTLEGSCPPVPLGQDDARTEEVTVIYKTAISVTATLCNA